MKRAATIAAARPPMAAGISWSTAALVGAGGAGVVEAASTLLDVASAGFAVDSPSDDVLV